MHTRPACFSSINMHCWKAAISECLLISQCRPAKHQGQDPGEDWAPGGRVRGQRGAQVVQRLQAVAPRSVQVALRIRREVAHLMQAKVSGQLCCMGRCGPLPRLFPWACRHERYSQTSSLPSGRVLICAPATGGARYVMVPTG